MRPHGFLRPSLAQAIRAPFPGHTLWARLGTKSLYFTTLPRRAPLRCGSERLVTRRFPLDARLMHSRAEPSEAAPAAGRDAGGERLGRMLDIVSRPARLRSVAGSVLARSAQHCPASWTCRSPKSRSAAI